MDAPKASDTFGHHMYEVELKAPADHETVRGRLRSLQASRGETIRQRDVYYQHPCRDFAATDEALRVRAVSAQASATSLITYKGPKMDDAAKTREELETDVGDLETVAAILEALGFEAVERVSKRRERWWIDDIAICLDDVDELGEYIEIELETDDDGLEAASDRTHEILRALEIDPEVTTTTSYLAMKLADGEGGG